METQWTAVAVGAAAAVWGVARGWQRLQLSLAKQPGLAGHSRLAKRMARWIPGYCYDQTQFFAADGAPHELVLRRRDALTALGERFARRYAESLAWTAQTRQRLSDLQLTGAYRVPFQFAPVLQRYLKAPAVMQSSKGVTLTDLDGNTFYDLTGSYGVNLMGQDFYKLCMAQGSQRAQALGPVLGSLHPCVQDVCERLCRLSGMDEVSFHMSGTEAVMQAVRLARYHTGRSHLVRFAGAYHGWWEDVQPGPGNPMPPRETYTLRDMHERSLQVLRSRHDIACVLVNPLQAMHPNRAAPSDSATLDSGRQAAYDKAAYTAWLQALRQVCTERGIVLIFDEVFMGFRLAPGGAQEYFGIRADMVTYGKTLGGGFPVGVVCGKAHLMKRFREDRPADLCFARGTFNAHPYVMASMQVFLEQLETPAVQTLYIDQEARWNQRCVTLNRMILEAGLPVQATNMLSVWTLSFTRASRYNWMFQYYLRDQGLALSWVGTGRLIFSLNFTDDDCEAVFTRIVAAARRMESDGWWWADSCESNRDIRRSVFREMLLHKWRSLHPRHPR